MANNTLISNKIGNLSNGSVLFAGSNGVITQDNTNLFWDDTNNRLGIGNNNPSATIDIKSNQNEKFVLNASADSANYMNQITFRNAGTEYAAIVAGKNGTNNSVGLYFTTGGVQRATISANGFLGIGKTSPTNVLNVLETNSNNTAAHIEHSATSGTIGGMQISFTGYSPNNTTSYYLIGVDTTTTRFIVYSNGNVVNTNGSYGAISDIKLKENIVDTSNKLEKLLKVRVVNYTLKEDPEKKPLIGVIAQELENVFSDLVGEVTRKVKDENGNEIDETVKSVKYSVFVPILIKALQEENEKVESLKTELAELKTLLQTKCII